MIELRFLGTLEIHLPEGDAPVAALTQPKRLALLLYLALAEPGGLQSRESLMALLWPEADDESARHSLRNALYGLRQALGEAVFLSRGEGYVGLEPAAVRCDALEVRRLLADHRWEEAVAAWGGDLVPGFHVSGAVEFDQWLEEQRTSLRRGVTDAAWRWVDELEKRGDAGLVPAARRAWALEPANEAGARRLMRFLHAAVGKAAGLRAYDELADYLRRECEAEPSAETQALAAELRRLEAPAFQASAATVPSEAGKEPRTQTPSALPAGPTHRRRISVTTAGIVGALLMAGIVSVFALRPTASTAGRSGAGLTEMTDAEGTLRLPARYREDTAAYAAYLRALTLRFQGDPTESRDAFAALVDREPLYAPAYSGLAHAYLFLVVNGLTPPKEGFPKADAAARKALALDSTLASAYTALGMTEVVWRWNAVRAGELFDRAIALDPQDPEAHILRGNWFRWQGEAESALVEARRAHELDPLNTALSNRVAANLFFARRYAEAEAMFRQTLRDYPTQSGSYAGLSVLYRAMGRTQDALEMLRTATEMNGDSAALALLPLATSDSQSTRVFADRSRQSLRDNTLAARAGDWVPASAWAFSFADLQDTNQTLRWLDSMVVQHDPMGQNVLLNPLFDFLRGDPRYREWEAKLPWRLTGVARGDTGIQGQ